MPFIEYPKINIQRSFGKPSNYDGPYRNIETEANVKDIKVNSLLLICYMIKNTAIELITQSKLGIANIKPTSESSRPKVSRTSDNIDTLN